jgi:manganese transport protein
VTVNSPFLNRMPAAAPKRTRPRPIALLGPAFVAAVAYVDPGNFATNFQAGAKFGYLLVWVVLAANLMAMFVQYLSAKVGLASGRDLPMLCRESFPRPVVWLLWAQAELVAMATDLAEFVGAAIGLNLLFGVPLFPAALATAAISFAILGLQRRGYRQFELAITCLLGLVAVGFCYQLLTGGAQSPSGFAAGLWPTFRGRESLILAVSIVGATVMPHVIYLHSALVATRHRPVDAVHRRSLLRALRTDCVLGLGLAGIINIVMLCVATAEFRGTGGAFDGSLRAAHAGLAHTVGGGAALAFAVALLSSGLSSSGVGTYAGQVIMQGFLRVRIPRAARRAVTMLPALAVLAAGVSPDTALVASQLVLSFGIPFALVPLALLTRRRDLMGDLVNTRTTSWFGATIAVLISGLNAYLLGQTLLG